MMASNEEEESAPSVHSGGFNDFDAGSHHSDANPDEGEPDDTICTTADGGGMSAGVYNTSTVNDEVFEELQLPEQLARDVQDSWRMYLKGAESREAAGEAIYSALFDAAPSLQSMFKTPRAVMAMRFANGLHQIVNMLHDPKALKIFVETLGFQHLEREVTIPRVGIFRDAIVDLLTVELGDALMPRVKDCWLIALNYVGGAFIYIRVKYADRLRCLATSWSQANGEAVEGEEAEGAAGDQAGEDSGAREQEEPPKGSRKSSKQGRKSFAGSFFGGKPANGAATSGTIRDSSDFKNTSVPKTFHDMFVFNAAVMGFGTRTWMQEILAAIDAIVRNVSNSHRLQEESDILALRMAKYKGVVTLSEFKSVMLASLRSLVKNWGSLHEVAWSWLWDNVERMLRVELGKPQKHEAALSAFLSSLDEDSLMLIRREVYSKFFTLAPLGQDYFKQSTTRLHFIADKVVAMTLDMYRDPKRMVEDISALGLRHVGYGIPTELFGPFVSSCVQVVRSLTNDDDAEESFRWSLGLVSRILTRVINEGSTIVMRAINANSAKMLRRAVACAPRGKRAMWTLNVQVGTQSISPLMWAIETGSHEAAKAIIEDLLTIRADRDRYYYGMDLMFERHPDIIQRLCLDAPGLMPVLLDGLIWRSRTTESGLRRVNYYIKHLVMDGEGEFAPAIEWITDIEDPKLVCHPVVARVTDLVWESVAFRTFLFGKMWFFITLVIFVLSQSVLDKLEEANSTDEVRISSFVLRVFVYLCSMGRGVAHHTRSICRDIRARDFVRVGVLRLPAYLARWEESAALCLNFMQFLMFCFEPILHCLGHGTVIFQQHCHESERFHLLYTVLSATATLFYFLLLTDLSVLSTRVSAYVLVCSRVLPEVGLFLFGLSFMVLAFACAISSLEQDSPDFASIPEAALQLYKMPFQMLSGARYDALSEVPALLAAILVYVVVSVIFLVNLLIAQLSCAYQATYLDMLGFARLNRGKIVVETMPLVSKKRWLRFVEGLRLDERVEFGEGDVGLAGGVRVFEPASANITTVDLIRRFGGSTSTEAQWPSGDLNGKEDVDRFDRLERLIEKATKRMSGRRKRDGAGSGGPSQHGSSSQSGSDGSMASEAE